MLSLVKENAFAVAAASEEAKLLQHEEERCLEERRQLQQRLLQESRVFGSATGAAQVSPSVVKSEVLAPNIPQSSKIRGLLLVQGALVPKTDSELAMLLLCMFHFVLNCVMASEAGNSHVTVIRPEAMLLANGCMLNILILYPVF